MAILTISVLLFAVFIADGATESKCGCPPDWEGLLNRCYFFVSTLQTWAEAEKKCLTLGGNLASVHNAAEDDFLKKLANNTRIWIGAYDAAQDGLWLWSDGSKFDYSGWISGEPNSYQGQSEDCGEIINADGWNDSVCSLKFASVCSLNLPK
ncbi:ladderlectin-like [Chanos chanos]|uniref:Ladderlectin-like n=1 Tax=Chanos chanos TaxID=29144 RepID=A0A6J2VXH3_CHACN|nr:ladderlectin-like [Chanos chanos]